MAFLRLPRDDSFPCFALASETEGSVRVCALRKVSRPLCHFRMGALPVLWAS